MIKNAVSLFAVLLLVAASCSASVINDIAVLTGGNTYTAGNYTLGNVWYAWEGFNGVKISIDSADVQPNATNLTFGFVTDPSIVTTVAGYRIIMRYEIWGPTDKVYLENTDGAGVLMLETVCKSSFWDNYGVCPNADVLGVGGARMGHDYTITLSQGVDHLYGEKVWQFDDAHISSFVNGWGTDSPEPVTFGLIGVGLALLGVYKRKVKA